MATFKATMTGNKSLIAKLLSTVKKNKGGTVLVGYTAAYAIFVHEMVGANFKKTGASAKFLEIPFREELWKETYRKAVKAGIPLDQALLLAGLRLQKDSQKIVPIDTGNLRASAFTRKEK